ncbi:hypothetical protein [Rhizobacter sp. P5_C2]
MALIAQHARADAYGRELAAAAQETVTGSVPSLSGGVASIANNYPAYANEIATLKQLRSAGVISDDKFRELVLGSPRATMTLHSDYVDQPVIPAGSPVMQASTRPMEAPTLSVGEQAIRSSLDRQLGGNLAYSYLVAASVSPPALTASMALGGYSFGTNIVDGNYADAAKDAAWMGVDLLAAGGGSKLTTLFRSEASLVRSDAVGFRLEKNMRMEAWADTFGASGEGYAALVKDLPKWDPMRTDFALSLREMRASGVGVRRGGNEMGPTIGVFGGESIENGMWFRYNPEKMRVVDMLEETTHWGQIKAGLPQKGYSPANLEILAKRSILNSYDLSPGLRFELRHDIQRVRDGSYFDLTGNH